MNVSNINASPGYKPERYGSGELLQTGASDATGIDGKDETTNPASHEQKLHEKMNQVLESMGGADTTVERSVYKDTNFIVYKIKDNETGKVLREIPEEKLLEMAARALDRNGLLIDKKI